MTDTVPSALQNATSALVADALDALGFREQTAHSRVKPLFKGARIVGRVYPVSVIEDLTDPAEPYAGEMDALAAMSPGDVGVYAVDPGSRAAAWGELFSCGAIGRGAVGAVVDGCVRDALQIEELGFPVFAADTSPLDTKARARVNTHGAPIEFAGVPVERGDLIVADVDGVIFVPAAAVDEVAELVSKKKPLEQGAREDLIAGMHIHDVWTKYGVF
ncbi:RraA family protein [Lysobacter korlensis]|uniref:Putative 4-hydroxy-4-methyl-2-oxoglutarate aldolase n=1 Tax=Lysobacter korlensis TaxID=553636 RepID=A0ABV6RW42_9GAMM